MGIKREKTSMDDFKPKYRKALWFALVFFSLCLTYLGPQVFENPSKDPMLTLSWFVIFILTSLVPTAIIKRIRFEKNWFIVEKYLGASKRILYEDVIDVGPTLLKYRGGKVNLHSVVNADDFMELISDKIDLDEFEGKLYKQEFDALVTYVWSAIPIFLVPVFVYFLPISSKWMPVVTLLIILVLVFLIGKVAEIRNNKLFDDASRSEDATPP